MSMCVTFHNQHQLDIFDMLPTMNCCFQAATEGVFISGSHKREIILPETNTDSPLDFIAAFKWQSSTSNIIFLPFKRSIYFGTHSKWQ